MVRWILALLLVASAATAVLAPALDMASARAAQGGLSGGSTAARSELSTQTAVPTPSATASTEPEEILVTPEPEPTASPRPTATRKAEPTKPPATGPTLTPTRKPEPSAIKEGAWEIVLRACLGRELESEACFRALSANGISLAQLKERIAARLQELARLHAQRPDLEAAIKACVASKDLNSEACQKAWRLSGLSLEEFRAKIAAKLGASQRSELELALRKCLDSHELYGAACYRAWQLSGLSSPDFDAKILADWRARETRTAP